MNRPAQSLRFLASSTTLYMTATVVQSAVSFFLIPLYARSLTKEEFGAMDQVMQFVMIVQLVAGMGLPLGMVRGFYLSADSEDTRRRMVGALVNLVVPLVAIIALVVFVFSSQLAALIFAGNGKTVWMQWCAGIILISSIVSLPFAVLRTLQISKTYMFWSVIITLVNGGLVVAAVLMHRCSLTTLLVIGLATNSVGAAGLLPGFLKYARLNFDFGLLRPMFAYGLPQLPNAAARKAVETAGRYMLPHFCGLAEVGTLVMGFKIAMILDTMILAPFATAWQPYFYSQANNPEARVVFGRVTGLAVMFLCFMMLLVEACKPIILLFLGGGRFTDSGPVVSALLVGFVLNGVQYTVAPGLHLTRRLVQEAGCMIASALACIGLNLALIPRFHAAGAALAQTGGYGIYLCITFFLAQHYYPVKYPWKKIGPAVGAAVVCFVVINAVGAIWLRLLVALLFAAACIGFDPTLPGSARSLARHVAAKFAVRIRPAVNV